MFLEGSYVLLLVFKLSDVMTLDSVDFGVIYTIEIARSEIIIYELRITISISQRILQCKRIFQASM